MSEPAVATATAQPCRDPECPGTAEPEFDHPYRYHECTECGFLFGYERIDVPDDGACAIGVPEEVRIAQSKIHDELEQRAVVNGALKRLPMVFQDG